MYYVNSSSYLPIYGSVSSREKAALTNLKHRILLYNLVVLFSSEKSRERGKGHVLITIMKNATETALPLGEILF